MDTVDADQLNRFSQALNQLRTSTPDLNGEPQLRSLADPTGSAFLHEYLERLPPNERSAVFSAEVPSSDQRPGGEVWLLKALLKQWGDADWDKREPNYKKEQSLKQLLKLKTELVVVADIHLLLPTPRQFDDLLSTFQTGNMMPLLIMGEPTQMQRLLASNERFTWRFPPLLWE
jgi:hypothetical protein